MRERASLVFLTLAFIIISIYLTMRIALLFLAHYLWYEKILAFALFFSEAFVMMHTIGYYIDIYGVTKARIKTNSSKPALKEHPSKYPPIAIVVAAYKEPLNILQDTLVCFYNLSYPNKHLYLLDDTRYDLEWDTAENRAKYKRSLEQMCQWQEVNLFRAKWHGAKAGKINDFIQFLAGEHKEGFEFTCYDKKQKREPAKYIIIFDADMNPLPDFIEDLAEIMENNPKIAFIQTPQYYSNFENNRVARAAGVQQAIFYEYICEGKSVNESMFCCGTNVMIRLEALRGVGGFDETSVTEDFATSLKFHLHGWQSLYINKVSAFGMGPEDLIAYFKQQFRWARGTVGMLWPFLGQMWNNFSKFPPLRWWEYFLSCTYYIAGWAFFVMATLPMIYIFFNIPSYSVHPELYFITFAPYITITLFILFWSLRERKYGFVNIICALLIASVSFSVYMKASASALLGLRSSFGITPKGSSNIAPLHAFLPQMTLSLLNLGALAWGILRMYYEREPFFALLLNSFWCFYNFMALSSFLYFNHSEESKKC